MTRTDPAVRSASRAAAGGWHDARTRLLTTTYGTELSPTADRASARRTARQATLWQIRVLASWLPPANGRLAHLAAAPFEISNVEQHLSRLAGQPIDDPMPLGSLSAAWNRVRLATSPEQVRSELARSTWRDPGGVDRAAITIGLRVAWGRRVATQVPDARAWAHGGLASLIAGERFVFDRDINEATSRELDRLFGTPWRQAVDIADLADRLPFSANWVLAGIETASDLWRCETAVLHRVVHDAEPIATSGAPTRRAVAAILALLLVDLWRVSASIEAAGRGPASTEVLDAVA